MEAGLKRCSKCREHKPRAEFGPRTRAKDGLNCHCRECHRQDTSSWYAANRDLWRERYATDPEWRKSRLDGQRARYYQGRKNKPIAAHEKARKTVSVLVRRGVLKRPLDCSKCGRSAGKIEAHHEDYSQPLAIVWLCKLCHSLRHRELNEQRAAQAVSA